MANKRGKEKRVVLGAGRFLRLVHANGWEFVERVRATGVVAIVAVTADGELILTEQFRPAVAGSVIDLPAGLAGDGPGTEELVTAARRELIEETGYDARRLTLLAHAPTSPGLTTEVVSFFRARGLKKVGTGGGIEGEKIEVHAVKLDRADAWLRRRSRAGIQIDCKVFAGLHFAQP
ncbi:MAG TPA: NUDIX hydrolase [Planctomycetaceae bacterium]|nr:NUDIX hydrolase [Planctomycetaceae bacterium]